MLRQFRPVVFIVGSGGLFVGCAPACESKVLAPLAACFGGDGVPLDGMSAAGTVAGTIRSLTTGRFPTACEIRFGGADSDEATIFEVEDGDGQITTVGLAGVTPPIEVGAPVTVDLAYTFGGFGPDDGVVRIRDANGTEQLVYGLAGEVDNLATPAGVTVGEGDRACATADQCGDWAGHDLTVDADGVAETVPYGGALDVGPWQVTHGGLERQTQAASTCPDYYVAHAEAAFVLR